MISHSRRFHPGHLVPECLYVLLHKATVVNRSEQDPTLPLTLPLPTVSAAFRATTGRHACSGRSSGWSEKCRKLDITVPDSVPPLLLRHDMIEPFLWGGELTLLSARGNFPGRGAVLSRYDRRSDDRGNREWWLDEWGM